MNGRLVVGVGNRSRGDDAVGLAVIDALRARLLDARLLESDGEPGRLIELWDGAELAVVVDAVRTGSCPPGTVVRFDASRDSEVAGAIGATTSSHGLGVDAAVGLARALDRLPASLAIVGVEVSDFEAGAPMTPAVAAAVDEVVEAVVQIVEEAT